MKKRSTILFLLFWTTAMTFAQSKSELQASIVTLTAKNDSLTKANTHNLALLDSLQRLTGVQVQNLDTVKSVLASRKAAQLAAADSLHRTSAKATTLKQQLDSLTMHNAKLQARLDSLTAPPKAVVPTAVEPVPAGAPGKAVPASKTDQLMKLNGMLEQGLITKEEFLRMKGELLK